MGPEADEINDLLLEAVRPLISRLSKFGVLQKRDFSTVCSVSYRINLCDSVMYFISFVAFQLGFIVYDFGILHNILRAWLNTYLRTNTDFA